MEGLGMEYISLLVGIVLSIMAILMRARKLNFLISRFRSFQKAIRRKQIAVDEKQVSIFYSTLFFVLAIVLFIGTIGQFMNSDNSELISWWTWIVCIVIGISGMLYLNLNKRFIKEV